MMIGAAFAPEVSALVFVVDKDLLVLSASDKILILYEVKDIILISSSY